MNFAEEGSTFIDSLLRELNYEGEVKSFEELGMASTFLKSVRSES